MTPTSALTLALALTSILALVTTVQAAGPWYVDPNGSDSNDCLSPGTACQTIGGAIGKATPGDTINVAGGVYTENLTIAKSLTLQGAGGGNTIVDGDGGVTNQRVMTITAGSLVTIADVAITNGRTTAGSPTGGDGGDGGGVYNQGTLMLIDSAVISNSTGNGGDSSAGDGGTGGHGGGIYNTGTLTMTNSLVISNTTGDGGNAVSGESGAGGDGGGIYSLGTLTINNTLVSANTTGGGGSGNTGSGNGGMGGGIYNQGTLTVNDSTISGNIARFVGGGIRTFIGTLTLNTSTVSGNTALNGGGIHNGKTTTLNNSTISGNHAQDYGGGLSNEAFGTLNLNNSTITNNTADSNGDGAGDGGGIRHLTGTVNLDSTIIAGNSDAGGEAPDCAGSVISQGYNLIGDTASCAISGDTTGNITGQDPNLGPLADNGGSTKTHALQAGSPATDQDSCSGLTADQRGQPRPIDIPNISNADDGCDIGAYEAQLEFILAKTVGDSVPPPKQLITYTISISNSGPMNATNAVISDTLPSGLVFAGPVTLEGASGTVAQNAADLPTLVSGLTIPAGQRITVTLPVTVNTGTAGGALITNTAAITSSEAPSPETASRAITVANVPPQAVDDLDSTPEDIAVTISVLSNDSDLNGEPLSIVAVGTPPNGSAAPQGAAIRYTPSLNFNGVNSFSYTISDGVLTDSAIVTVTVTPVNDAPQFTSTPITTVPKNVAYSYAITAFDVESGGVVTITAPTLPAWLTLTDNGGGSGSLNGTPSDSEVGEHGVVLQVSDGVLTGTQAFTVTVQTFSYFPLIMKN